MHLVRQLVLLLSILAIGCGSSHPGDGDGGRAAEGGGDLDNGDGADGGQGGAGQDATEGENEPGGNDGGADPGDGGDDGAENPGQGDDGSPGDGDDGASEPTWHRDVRPILKARCGNCHVEGGAAPFDFDTLEQTRIQMPSGIVAIEEGRMPPWKADPDCRRYRDERLIPHEEVAQLKEWLANGMPEGDEADAPVEVEAVDDAGPPDLMFKAKAGYVPKDDRPDDYRCFPLDMYFEEETYMIRSQVIPGRVDLVHHVLLYRVPAESADELADLDASDPGPGYTCYGGPGVGGGGPVGAWVPGMPPSTLDEGAAVVMGAGTRIVMQIHYNVLAADPVEDLTEWHVWTTTEVPAYNVRSVPQPLFDFVIRAGDASSVHVREFANRQGVPIVVLGAAPHMHVLGTKIRVDHIKANGEEECVVNIPDWDFNWQQPYVFRRGEELILQPDEAFRLTCEFDNSAAHQPVVNGERLQPRDVTWGEGTHDEMCLNFIQVIEPYGEAGADCAMFPNCTANCEDPSSFGCWMECLTGNLTCAQCSLGGMIGNGGCLRDSCPLQGLAVQDCFRDCVIEGVTGGSILDCAKENCPEGWDALASCMDPVIAIGQCDGHVETCGASLD